MITELVLVRVQRRLTKDPPPGLLQPNVHAREEGAAYEGHLVHNEEHDAAPLLLQLAQGVAEKPALPCIPARIRHTCAASLTKAPSPKRWLEPN